MDVDLRAFEREQVDTVFEGRSGYPDLTTEGEDMINSSGIKDHPVVSHEEWLSARAVFHTYSCYSRGVDMMNATYQYLDLVPKGRDEAEGPLYWVGYHDTYQED
jgi:hypothetical protein